MWEGGVFNNYLDVVAISSILAIFFIMAHEEWGNRLH